LITSHTGFAQLITNISFVFCRKWTRADVWSCRGEATWVV